MLIQQITWDVSPLIFKIGGLQIRWYGLFFALSFYLGYVILEKQVFKREHIPVGLLDKLATYVVIGTIVGARLGHIFFYEPMSYLKDPISILKIWEGGLASHGAAVGILLALILFIRKSGKTYLWTLDRLVIVVALAGFFIRMGNLMNSEIYGYFTNLPWGFVYLRDGQTEPRHPTQIYEALCYLILFIGLLLYYRRNYLKMKEGTIFGVFLVVLFGIRFLIEFVKEPQVAFEQGMTLNMGQWLSLPFIMAGLGLLWYINRKNNPV